MPVVTRSRAVAKQSPPIPRPAEESRPKFWLGDWLTATYVGYVVLASHHKIQIALITDVSSDIKRATALLVSWPIGILVTALTYVCLSLGLPSDAVEDAGLPVFIVGHLLVALYVVSILCQVWAVRKPDDERRINVYLLSVALAHTGEMAFLGLLAWYMRHSVSVTVFLGRTDRTE